MEGKARDRSASSTRAGNASSADRAKGKPGPSAPGSAARSRPTPPASASSQQQRSGRGSSSTARTESRNVTSRRGGKRLGSAAAAQERGRGKSISGATAAGSAVSEITDNALASINYELFSQPNMTAKQVRNRMLKEFLHAHLGGAQKIEAEWDAGYQRIWREYLDNSYVPHSREIRRLLEYAEEVETTCQQRLDHAQSVTQCALAGIEKLVECITNVGTEVHTTTGVLSEEQDVLLGPLASDYTAPRGSGGVSPSTAAGVATPAPTSPAKSPQERGRPARDVCGVEAVLTDPHPAAFRITATERHQRDRLRRVFNGVLDSIGSQSAATDAATAQGDTRTFWVPPATTTSSVGSPMSSTTRAGPQPDTSDSDVANITAAASPLSADASPMMNVAQRPSPADEQRLAERSIVSNISVSLVQAQRSQRVHDLQSELDNLGADFVQLMDRVKVQHQQYQHKIAAQQYALDAQATRVKLADDVLRDTVGQGEVEAVSAVAAVQKLSLELRERMAASEAAMDAALRAIISESAEVCFDNDVLHEYDSLAIKKENCLFAYMSRMERQVVEQAEVLRQAQDGVAHIWKLQHQHQQHHSASMLHEDGQHLDVVDCSADVTPLPPPYERLLKECDRPTLLRFLERLATHCPEATAHLIGALDEHEAFCATHPHEADAAREQLARTAAVQQLLERLDEEGRLHCSGRLTCDALSVRLRRLVEQYDAYVDFNEAYARALVRQADAERRQPGLQPVAFFEARTPVPGLPAGRGASLAPSVSPGSPGPGKGLFQKRTTSNAESAGSRLSWSSRAGRASTELPSKAGAAAPSAMPYLSLWHTKLQEIRQRQYDRGDTVSANADSHNVGSVVGYLARHPSRQMAPAAATAGSATAPSNLFETGPSTTRGRLHTAISASATTSITRSPPPPPVPPRVGLTAHIVATYGSSSSVGGASARPDAAASAAVGNVAGPGPRAAKAEKAKAALPFRDGDRQFIQREREIFVQLD